MFSKTQKIVLTRDGRSSIFNVDNIITASATIYDIDHSNYDGNNIDLVIMDNDGNLITSI